jgi:hypothetical protein
MPALTTRHHWATTRPVSGLVKVCCMGDSLMHGAGVAPCDAFPARLEHHLNAETPEALFITENWGVRRTNLWNAIQLFRDRTPPGGCDMAVFSVCNNDANLFENVLTYDNPTEGEEQNRWWESLKPELAVTLADLQALSAQRGVPVLLVWFGMRADDGPAVDTMAELCRQAGLPFMDGLRFLQGMGYEDCDPRLWATPVDAHLSALALDQMARWVAKEIARRPPAGYPAAGRQATGPITADEVLHCVDAVAAADGEGVALRWGTVAVAAKAVAARRFTPREARRAVGDDFAAAQATLSARFRRWRQAAAWEAILDSLKADAPLMAEIDGLLRNAGEMIYCADRFPDTPLTADILLQADNLKMWTTPYPDGAARGPRITAIDRRFAALTAQAADRPDLVPALSLLAAARRHLGVTAADLDRLGDPDRLPPSAQALARWAGNEIGRCLGRLERIAGRVDRVSAAGAAVPAFYTRVDIYAQAPDLRRLRRYAYLELRADYRAPFFSPACDGHLLITDGLQHLYRLEIPLFLQGEITLLLAGGAAAACPRGLGMIDRIEIVSGDATRTLHHQPEWDGVRTVRIALCDALLC